MVYCCVEKLYQAQLFFLAFKAQVEGHVCEVYDGTVDVVKDHVDAFYNDNFELIRTII